MYNKKTITHLVLSGGGGSGFIYIGALRYLQQENYLQSIKHISGTSIGSLFGVLFALDISMGDIELYMKENLNYDNITINFLDLVNEYGVLDSKDDYFFNIVRKFFEKYNYHTYTFMDLSKNKGINMYIHTIHFETMKEFVFSIDNTPNVLLLDAIFASMSLPFVYKPYKIGNELYIDGGLTNNIPVDIFFNVNKDNILILQSCRSLENCVITRNNTNIINYMLNILNITNMDKSNKKLLENNYKYYLTFKNNPILTIPYSIDDNFKLLINITEEMIDMTVIEGYEQIYKFINSP